MGKSLAELKGRDARKAEADLNSLIGEVLGGKVPGIEGSTELASLRKVANG
jgi:hypothetical protein